MNIIPLVQGSEEWEDWRFNGVGGSDLAAILGISPFDDHTRESVLEEKVNRLRRPVNYAMRRGIRMEPLARDAYLATIHTDHARPVCVEHRDYRWIRSSLDLLCVAGNDQWVAELKVPNKDRHIEATAGFVPYYYQAQCQWQMLCTGLDVLHYVSYSELDSLPEEKRLAVVTVERDDKLIARLMDRAAEFWMDVVTEREKRGLEVHS